MAAVVPSQCGSTAFKQWCHCLCNAACLWNAAALHPNTAALPVDCSNTAFRMWQHCLWTAAPLLLDSDTAFPMRQHYLQLVAALPSHGSSSAFTMWHYCLQKLVPLPLECCMPLECCSTASQHCSSANPHGAPLSLPGPGRTGGTRVYPPLCGGGWYGVPSKPPRGVPIPPRPRQDRRDSGVSAAVWGWVVWCPLITPTGRPYPSPAQAGPEGLGCIRRCVGVDSVPS